MKDYTHQTYELQLHDVLLEDVESPIKIFLAGTIDMGNSEDWQKKFIEYLIDDDVASKLARNIIIYNPRRRSGAGFKSDNKFEMEYQVNWELDHLEEADVIIMNLLPNSKSPISLMELGLFYKKMLVVCPPEFYRYDNVRIVCKRFGIDLYHTFGDLNNGIKQ